MKKITEKMREKMEKTGKYPRNWNSGAVFSLSLTWDAENHVISANEVGNDLKAYLAKWPGKKKFHTTNPGLYISYTR